VLDVELDGAAGVRVGQSARNHRAAVRAADVAELCGEHVVPSAAVVVSARAVVLIGPARTELVTRVARDVLVGGDLHPIQRGSQIPRRAAGAVTGRRRLLSVIPRRRWDLSVLYRISNRGER